MLNYAIAAFEVCSGIADHFMKPQDILIRDKKETDHSVISDVTQAAFKTLEVSNHTERCYNEKMLRK